MNTDKFKVWDNDEKRFLSKPVLIDQDGDVFGLAYSSQIVYYDVDFKIVHSTGLLDKNGTEIYEGDIIDKGYHNLDVHDELGEVHMGEGADSDGYNHGEWYGWLAGGSSLLDVHRECEVIGNIYEHPHLLRGGSP